MGSEASKPSHFEPRLRGNARPVAVREEEAGPWPVFHPGVGPSVQLSDGNCTAERVEDNEKAFVFSTKPLAIGEQFVIKIEKVAPEPKWFSFTFGLTSCDPTLMDPLHRNESCRPFIGCRGYSNYRRIFNARQEGDVLSFERTASGSIRFKLKNSTEPEVTIFGVDRFQPLYPWVNLHGWVAKISVSFAKSENNLMANPYIDKRATVAYRSFMRHGPKPEVTETSSEASMKFLPVKSSNILLSGERSFAERVDNQLKGYVFAEPSINSKHRFTIIVQNIDERYEQTFSFGLTSCDPATINPNELPSKGSDLIKRREYWVLAENVFTSALLRVGDKLTFKRTKHSFGGVSMQVNNQNPVYLFYLKWSRELFAFFNLNGCVTKIEIMKNSEPERRGVLPAYERVLRPASSLPLLFRSMSATPRQAPEDQSQVPEPFTFRPLKFLCQLQLDVSVSPDQQVAERNAGATRPYVAVEYFDIIKKKIAVEVLATDDVQHQESFAFGLTNCSLDILTAADFPEDCTDLMDRPEYWVIRRNIINGTSTGDIIVFEFKPTGEVTVIKNNGLVISLFHVDIEQKFSLVFCLNGVVAQIKLLGTVVVAGPPVPFPRPVAPPRRRITRPAPPPPPPPPERKGTQPSQQQPQPQLQPEPVPQPQLELELNEDCVICFDGLPDVALYPCGHASLCHGCASKQWKQGTGRCPICQQEIFDVLRIYR